MRIHVAILFIQTVTSRPDEKFIQALEADDRTLTYAKTEDELQMEDQTVDYEHGKAFLLKLFNVTSHFGVSCLQSNHSIPTQKFP